MVTFEEIREFQRKERQNPKIVPLPKDFWKSVADYFADKMKKYEELKKTTSRFTDKVLAQFERELRNAGRVIVELYTLREKKMLLMAWSEVGSGIKADVRALTPEEKEIFERIVEDLEVGRDAILASVLAGERAEEKKEEKKEEGERVRVRIIEKIPAFLGTDLNLYGPYEKDEIVELPARYAKLLIEKGKAVLEENV